MTGVRHSGEVRDRLASGYRRATGTFGWTYVVAMLLGAATLIELSFRSAEPRSNAALVLILAPATTLPVALARAQPVLAALLITTAGLTTLLVRTQPPAAGLVALIIALYLVGRRSSWRAAVLLAALFAGYATAAVDRTAPGGPSAGLILLAVAVAAITAGVVQRIRTQEAQRDASLRTMTDTLLQHAALGERARIARELHDVVAHHLSMIAVQAEAARLTTAGMPPEGARRLSAIGDTARAALTEMRRLLGVLREDRTPEPPRRPQPGLQQLNELLDEARELAGGSTRLIVQGWVRPLDPGLELIAYRIVQEALTNARRHATGAGVDVELDYRDDVLRLRVRDNGPGPGPDGIAAAASTGHGLTGMSERAAMVGGTFTAGPGPVGGFLVDAVLPVTGAVP